MKDVTELLKAIAPLFWRIVFLAVVLIFRKNIQDIFSRIRRGKMFGQELELSEVVEEAKSTIKELQLLEKIIGSATLSLVKRSGRSGTYSDEDKEHIKNSIVDVLQKVGISNEEINDILKEWHQFVTFDYALFILGARTLPSGLTPEQQKQWKGSAVVEYKTFQVLKP